MDGENNGRPYEQMDDLGCFPTIFRNTHMQIMRPTLVLLDSHDASCQVVIDDAIPFDSAMNPLTARTPLVCWVFAPKENAVPRVFLFFWGGARG